MLDRLERIETLHLAGASAAELIGELRRLVAEAEAWTAVEGDERAAAAVAACRDALALRVR